MYEGLGFVDSLLLTYYLIMAGNHALHVWVSSGKQRCLGVNGDLLNLPGTRDETAFLWRYYERRAHMHKPLLEHRQSES
jgi:hypothetical protein